MNFNRLFVVIAAFFCFGTSYAFDTDLFARKVTQAYLQGEESHPPSLTERDEKSYRLALALGFSPITGDGLYYTKHPAQGTLALLTGIVGLPLLIAGLTMNTDKQNCDDCGMRNTLIGTGALFYGSAYVWDSLATLFYAGKYK